MPVGSRSARLFRAFRTCAALMAAAVFSTAHAAPLIASEVLQQFNLVVFEDARSSSHVDGRSYIGGNLQGGDYVQHPNDMPVSAYAGLVVRGNASNLNVNGGGISVGGNLSTANINSGAAYVGGNASNVNFNGGSAYVGGTNTGSNFNGGLSSSATVQAAPDGIEDTLRNLSQQLAGLADTGGTVSVNGNRASFRAVANTDGLAVFDLSTIDTTLFKTGEFSFDIGDADLVVFNVDELVVDIVANFLAGSAQSLGSRLIWNFYNATDITLHSQFGGTVLAPNAALTNYNNIEGSVVVNSLAQYGEIHLQPLAADLPPDSRTVPEPGSLALALGALLLLAGITRSRRPLRVQPARNGLGARA